MSKSKSSSPLNRENKPAKKINKKPASGHKTSYDVVKRHLSNKDDKITDDDFKTLKIDLSIPEDRAHKPLPVKPDKERPKDSEQDNDTLTPWDVISE